MVHLFGFFILQNVSGVWVWSMTRRTWASSKWEARLNMNIDRHAVSVNPRIKIRKLEMQHS